MDEKYYSNASAQELINKCDALYKSEPGPISRQDYEWLAHQVNHSMPSFSGEDSEAAFTLCKIIFEANKTLTPSDYALIVNIIEKGLDEEESIALYENYLADHTLTSEEKRVFNTILNELNEYECQELCQKIYAIQPQLMPHHYEHISAVIDHFQEKEKSLDELELPQHIFDSNHTITEKDYDILTQISSSLPSSQNHTIYKSVVKKDTISDRDLSLLAVIMPSLSSQDCLDLCTRCYAEGTLLAKEKKQILPLATKQLEINNIFDFCRYVSTHNHIAELELELILPMIEKLDAIDCKELFSSFYYQRSPNADEKKLLRPLTNKISDYYYLSLCETIYRQHSSISAEEYQLMHHFIATSDAMDFSNVVSLIYKEHPSPTKEDVALITSGKEKLSHHDKTALCKLMLANNRTPSDEEYQLLSSFAETPDFYDSASVLELIFESQRALTDQDLHISSMLIKTLNAENSFRIYHLINDRKEELQHQAPALIHETIQRMDSFCAFDLTKEIYGKGSITESEQQLLPELATKLDANDLTQLCQFIYQKKEEPTNKEIQCLPAICKRLNSDQLLKLGKFIYRRPNHIISAPEHDIIKNISDQLESHQQLKLLFLIAPHDTQIDSPDFAIAEDLIKNKLTSEDRYEFCIKIAQKKVLSAKEETLFFHAVSLLDVYQKESVLTEANNEKVFLTLATELSSKHRDLDLDSQFVKKLEQKTFAVEAYFSYGCHQIPEFIQAIQQLEKQDAQAIFDAHFSSEKQNDIRHANTHLDKATKFCQSPDTKAERFLIAAYAATHDLSTVLGALSKKYGHEFMDKKIIEEKKLMKAELAFSKAKCEALGITPVIGFSHSHGNTAQKAIKLLSRAGAKIVMFEQEDEHNLRETLYQDEKGQKEVKKFVEKIDTLFVPGSSHNIPTEQHILEQPFLDISFQQNHIITILADPKVDNKIKGALKKTLNIAENPSTEDIKNAVNTHLKNHDSIYNLFTSITAENVFDQSAYNTFIETYANHDTFMTLNTKQLFEEVEKQGKPALGICFGNQALAYTKGAKIYKIDDKDKRKDQTHYQESSSFFVSAMNPNQMPQKHIPTFSAHEYAIKMTPNLEKEARVTATSSDQSIIHAIELDPPTKRMRGSQPHPEVSGNLYAQRIILGMVDDAIYHVLKTNTLSELKTRCDNSLGTEEIQLRDTPKTALPQSQERGPL